MNSETLSEILYGKHAKLSSYDNELSLKAEQLLSQLNAANDKLKHYKIELWYDGREKCNTRSAFAKLGCAKQVSSDTGDFRIMVNGKLYQIYERKSVIDALQSIDGRSQTQHLKMLIVSIPHYRKFYLFEEVSDQKWNEFRQNGTAQKDIDHLHGAQANCIHRDGFSVVYTKSLLDTVYYFMKGLMKCLENIERITNLIDKDPDISEECKQASWEQQVQWARRSDIYWWANADLATDSSTVSASALQECRDAALHQQRTKKRQLEKEMSELGGNNSTNLSWIKLLSQIPKMNVKKAIAVQELFNTLFAFVHACEQDPGQVFSKLKDLEMENRRFGPALAQQVMAYFGVLYEPPAKKPRKNNHNNEKTTIDRD